MQRSLGFCVTLWLASLIAPLSEAGEVSDYLTRDGELKETVSFSTGTIQFLAPPGEEFVIQPSGEWEMKFTDLHGKLSERQLAALAQHLATQDFNSLPKSQGFEVPPNTAGYDFVTIGFGKREATFHIKSGASRDDYLPPMGDSKAAAWARFVALELILSDMLKRANLDELKSRKAKSQEPGG